MRLGVLFSGGKDSTYSIYKAKSEGHKIVCLITIHPLSEESMLLHYPNTQLTKFQSELMNIPQLTIESNSNEPNLESKLLQKIITEAKNKHKIDGIVHGGISSKYQQKSFTSICEKLGLSIISPLWQKNQKEYMQELIEAKFHFIIVSVTTSGLDDSWLGKEITISELPTLERLAIQHGFNLNFEGGEAETLVLDCPLFTSPLKIIKARKIWDGYRGRFEILEAKLDPHAR